MFSNYTGGRPVRRSLSLAGAIAGAVLFSSAAALAGECPADKVGVDVMKPGATAVKGATDQVLGKVDLGKEIKGFDQRFLRMRYLTIQPGGEIAWHSHVNRPGLIYILEGTVTEYSSTCAVPIVHKAGEVSTESDGESHWWKNTGNTVVRLLAADIFHDTMKTTSR